MAPTRATNASGGAAGGRKASAGRITVLIAEDHRVLREALLYALEGQRDLRVVGAVGNGGDAVKEAGRLAPRAVLMSMLLPGLDGLEATRLIVQRSSATGVVLLSPHASPVIVNRALDAGALGYVTRDCSLQEVMRALRSAGGGRRYLGQRLAEGFIDAYRGPLRAERTAESLTSAERNILRLVVDGKTNPEVARVTGLSPRTVETYRIRMMRKLGLESFAALVKYAIRHGLATLD